MNELNKNVSGAGDLRHMTPRDLAMWGMQDIAFVKQVTVDDEPGWSIHAADGTHMGIAPDRDLAFAAVRQHDMEPVSVH